MAQPLALVRADTSSKIGTGHMYRCLAFARALSGAGFRTAFYSRAFEPAFTEKFRAAFTEKKIPFHVVASEAEFTDQLAKVAPNILFLDLRENKTYAPLLTFLKQRPDSLKLISVDTVYLKDIRVDLTVLPYWNPQTKSNGENLTGLQYFILREELALASAEHAFRFPVKNALITMGGTDPFSVTFPIAETICPQFPEIQFTAVVGPGFKKAKHPAFPNLRLEFSPRHLGDLYSGSDIAIIAGGLTKYETALFGLPSLILAQSEEEERLCPEFALLGTSEYLGAAKEFSAPLLECSFASLVKDEFRLRAMYIKGKTLVDTRGSERIIEHIKEKLQ